MSFLGIISLSLFTTSIISSFARVGGRHNSSIIPSLVFAVGKLPPFDINILSLSLFFSSQCAESTLKFQFKINSSFNKNKQKKNVNYFFKITFLYSRVKYMSLLSNFTSHHKLYNFKYIYMKYFCQAATSQKVAR